ncbi:integrator complex subunit 2-like isoform X2 [Sycon ciliatum]|uniref:integrator complex subunit 2-like isoform X2 n=1 Tax=Sycon ciliatum TaxID=27933 RepID=UPI0031F675DF
MNLSPELKRGFHLLRDGDVERLVAELGYLGDNGQALRPFLPFLVRVALMQNPECSSSEDASRVQFSILAAIGELEAVNSIVASLSFDRDDMRRDVEKEKLMRSKQISSGGLPDQDSHLIQGLKQPIEVEFEQAHPTRKLRLFMCELLRLVSVANSHNGIWYPISNALFDCPLYFQHVIDLLHLALTELHSLVSCAEVTSVLLRLEHGCEMLVQLAAGLPHFQRTFLDTVVEYAFRGGVPEVSQSWRACNQAMQALCQMDAPQAALRIRDLCVKTGGPACCMLLLTDELAKHSQGGGSGVWLDFITSLLLHEKSAAKDALIQYVSSSQKKGSRLQKANPAFESLLENIHRELLALFMASHPQTQLLSVMSGATASEGVSTSVSEMVIDMGIGRDSSTMTQEADGSFVHEEVMDIGMPVSDNAAAGPSSTADAGGGGGGVSDSLNDGFTEVEELPFQSGAVTGETVDTHSLTSFQLNAADEDLFKQFDGSVLGLDASVLALAQSSASMDVDGRPLLRLPESETQRACKLLRSFCALVGIANLRLSGEQTEPLVQLITARPPLTEAGARFVELALCTLLICPSLTGDIEHSRCVVDWLRWLLKEQPAFDRALGSHVPYGELLLLVAIHYHGGQLERIVELVRRVLGINITISSSRLISVKMLFTQDVFTEKVVMEHAVQVGVTPSLSAHMSNYLPVHCLVELLQARSFARHATKLKEWIYRQVLDCAAPVHPLVPQLLEEFVKTLILPIQGVTQPSEGVHKGFSDSEILAVFKDGRHETSATIGNRTQGQATSASVTTDSSSTSGRHSVANGDGTMDASDGATPATSWHHSQAGGAADSPIAQLLILYYVLMYHDCLLANLKSIMAMPTVSRNANPVALSSFSLVSKMPVKRLLVYARTSPRNVGSLYSRLLRLLLTHLPHLCLTQDWLAEDSELLGPAYHPAHNSSHPAAADHTHKNNSSLPDQHNKKSSSRNFNGWLSSLGQRRVRLPTPEQLRSAYSTVCQDPALCTSYMKCLCSLRDAPQLLPYLDTIVGALPKLLDVRTPRVVITSTATLWTRLSSVSPGQLWVGTVNALHQNTAAPLTAGNMTPPLLASHAQYTEEDLVANPLLVLSCRREVFRCAVIFDLVCRVLMAYLAASRADLTEHSHSQLVLAHRRSTTGANIAVMEHESEEIRSAMCSTQDSLAVQLLIEVCAPNKEEMSSGKADSDLSALTEIRGIVSSVLHQMFIDDPSIAKLVHFQGYDERLLPVFIASVPSIYICVDFIPELLSQPQPDKQIFALQLCFHLCSHYPLPRTLSVARSAMSHLSGIISTRSLDEYSSVFLPVLPSLTRACRVLPALLDDAVPLVGRLGRILNTTLPRISTSALLTPPVSPVWKTDTMTEVSSLAQTGVQQQQLLQALQTVFNAV